MGGVTCLHGQLPTQRQAHLSLQWNEKAKAAVEMGCPCPVVRPEAHSRPLYPWERRPGLPGSAQGIKSSRFFVVFLCLSLCPGIMAEPVAHSIPLELLTIDGVSHAVFYKTWGMQISKKILELPNEP